ncbi:hypothetical protein SLE2022_352790 [Rubroshorea leprosula]
MEQLLFRTLPFLLLLVFLHSSQTLAQGPAAAPTTAPAPPAPVVAPAPPAPVAAPTPPAPAAAPIPPPPVAVPAPPVGAPSTGPTDVTKILQKAGQFVVFNRLLRATSEASQLYGQLNNSNSAYTIFAPTDNAFSSLKSGTLNKLNDEEKTELVQFHIVPTYLTPSLFQTVSNPVSTQAGDSGPGRFQLNVTTVGTAVNLTSGITNTSISGTVYTDGQLAIYQIDQVLLPLAIFGPKPPHAPAPAPVDQGNKKKKSEADNSVTSACGLSFAMQNVIFLGVISTLTAFCW